MTITATAPDVAREHPRTDRDVGGFVTDALALGMPLRIVGNGTWLDANRPVTAERALSMRECAGIVEYVPGDLVITVGAGATLAEIAAVTAEHRQWLALDPVGSDNGTIGATVATASSGPLALGVGTIRDLVLGLRVVSGTGALLRVGGRVVKNVAGFDLVRLSTGAYGTLGVLTQVSLRLHAQPARDHTYVIELPESNPSAMLTALGNRALSFQALELLNPTAATRVGINSASPYIAVVRVMGNPARVHAQRDALSALGVIREVDPTVWSALRAEDADSAVLRVTAAPTALNEAVDSVTRALAAAHITNAELRLTPYRGAVRVSVANAMHADPIPITTLLTALRETCAVAVEHVDDAHRRASIASATTANRCTIVGERLPNAAWSLIPPATVDPLSQRIRHAFDPRRILNRGIFGEPAP